VDRLEFDDIELTYELRGTGARVVFVHASPFVSWYGPLVDQLPAFSALTYRRRVQRLADGPYRALSVAEDAATCIRLMDHVGWSDAHIVGHSYGALVALQAAVDRPDRMRSVALLEPAARGVSSSAAILAALGPVVAAYQSGDKAAAVDGFLRHVCGDRYRAVLDQVLPHAFDEAVAEADLFFQAEMPAVQRWSFGPSDGARVRPPVLNVLGSESVPRFVEGADVVQSWLPHAERLSVPGAGHLLMVQNPTALAQGLLDFYSRHPSSATVARI
jgi:pimeloyl-ACP methyl ester carboxylesterase